MDSPIPVEDKKISLALLPFIAERRLRTDFSTMGFLALPVVPTHETTMSTPSTILGTIASSFLSAMSEARGARSGECGEERSNERKRRC